MDADMDMGDTGVKIDMSEFDGLDTSIKDDGPKLDLVFILDCTGSMGSYIRSATKNIEVIVQNISDSGKLSHENSLRIGLVAYRDHPPQDSTYVTRSYPLTSNVLEIKEALKGCSASGGGDGPEALTPALYDCLKMEWREDASKMAVVITDAPPHALGEYGDGFAVEDPCGYDPLQLAREMAKVGITLFAVACEPGLSTYLYAVDLLKALTLITSGTLIPLTTADWLSHVIVGSALEQMDMEKLIREVGGTVSEALQQGGNSVDDIAQQLHETLMLRNETTKHLVFEQIYKQIPESEFNVQLLANSDSLAVARPNLQKVRGARFTEDYLNMRYKNRNGMMPKDLPPRPSEKKPFMPSSPPKSFQPFKASPGMTVQSTPLGGVELSPDEELEQSINLKLSSISLDQAKRITIASAWRAAAPRR